jgi:hypothetical protein
VRIAGAVGRVGEELRAQVNNAASTAPMDGWHRCCSASMGADDDLR